MEFQTTDAKLFEKACVLFTERYRTQSRELF